MDIIYKVLIGGIAAVGIVGLCFVVPMLKKRRAVTEPYPLVVAPPEGSAHIALGNEDDISAVNGYIDRRIKEHKNGNK